MGKIVAAFNVTIDGNCDHTAGLPDAEIHDHYTSLLNNAGKILYGRTTFELMKYWQGLLENPAGEPSLNNFAAAIDRIPKIVFSHTLQITGWQTASLANKPLADFVAGLRNQPGDVLVGSRSLIIQLLNLQLIDELQLCIQPVGAGRGLQLFDDIDRRLTFTLGRTKIFSSGAVIHHYQPAFNKDD